jgi:predicted ATPase
MVGTVAYMSPEHTTGKKADHRSDLWSLGVSLYEMVAGRRPFEGEYEAAVLYAIAHEDPEPLSDDLPEWLRAVIMRLLAKTPDERFDDAGALLVALQTQTAPQAPPRRQAVRNAPSYLTRFFGRGEELEQLAALLAVSRLVTLSGPAGAGKTRLSLELAGNVASRFADGACFAPLAAIEDPELTASAIAKSVGMEPAAGGALLESLKAYLANREMLLVLDNFEQILDAAPIVGELLAAAPRLKVLVTSRAPLGLEGERDFPAPPLEAPDLRGEAAIEKLLAASAIQLFVDRAQAVRPNFALTDSNASEVARLCKSLDGLPLAIELAAARTKLFSPKALLSKLSERLDVLKASSRGGPERHRTLRQAIAWSYDLLDERAQGFFRRMAVFNNGWTIEAAEALWSDRGDDALELLEALCDQSLARQVGGPQEQPRFLLLETIRTFGLDLLAELGEEEDARRRHAEHFLRLSETAAPKLTTAAAREWLDALEADHDNLRAALVWAEKQPDKETALRLGSALWRFWVTRGYTPEGFERMKRIVSGDVENVSPKVLLAALHGFSTLSHYKGRMDDAIEASKKSLELARQGEDQLAVAAALNNLGWVYAEITSLRPARGYSEEALELARREGDTRGAALALNNLGWISTYEGDCNAARRYHEEGLELRRLIGDGRGTAFVQAGLAWAEEGHGNLERAYALTEQAMRTMESIRDVVISGFVRLVQARIFLNQGLDEKVVEVTQHEVDHWDPGGHRMVLAWLKVKLGQALHNLGRRERARQLMRESAEIFEEMSCPWGGGEVLLAQAVALRSEGDDAASDSAFRKILRISSELGAKGLVCEALEGLAGAAVVPSSDAERLAVGLGAAEALRERLGARAPQSRREALAKSEDRLRAAVGEREFEHAKQRGRNAELDEVISLAADGG